MTETAYKNENEGIRETPRPFYGGLKKTCRICRHEMWTEPIDASICWKCRTNRQVARMGMTGAFFAGLVAHFLPPNGTIH